MKRFIAKVYQVIDGAKDAQVSETEISAENQVDGTNMILGELFFASH